MSDDTAVPTTPSALRSPADQTALKLNFESAGIYLTELTEACYGVKSILLYLQDVREDDALEAGMKSGAMVIVERALDMLNSLDCELESAEATLDLRRS